MRKINTFGKLIKPEILPGFGGSQEPLTRSRIAA
jgi:hypothetical protein